ncbi:hypothetical protein BCV72DRAFT_69769 [Rhizopus microsporus var. microsporus]|uniref:Uncharacterized protein n=1 Tax=Rhizopus microsporus var. microsporus TaxID=86635 RepID=A0A1X0QPH6_RHIZD|nr:hypothetical protein BCV72DRAFT_69769 [Rhizopus microsporus var. microsporus]
MVAVNSFPLLLAMALRQPNIQKNPISSLAIVSACLSGIACKMVKRENKSTITGKKLFPLEDVQLKALRFMYQ